MNASEALGHEAVMLAQAVDGLAVQADGRYLDGTFGRGGHARAVLAKLGAHGRLLVMDRDPQAIATAQREFAGDARVQVRHGNFADMAQWPEAAAGLDGVLLDLGVSSPQLDDAARGFSFQGDGPLDMRMDPTQGLSAAQWLAQASETEISEVLWRHGEERMSRRIARAIVEQRRERALATTGELARLVSHVIGRREPHKHPATRTFQALRIHINDELGSLAAGLAAATRCLKPGGRLAVISFHSLEDRIVKRSLRDQSRVDPALARLPQVPAALQPRYRLVTRALRPTDAEIAANPRARSAVLRAAERIR